MGEFTTLMARDGHEFQAWLCAPQGPPRGAVIIVQEIFGVNGHIRSVADEYARQGFLTIAPALFDRVRRGVQLGYSADEIQEGYGYRLQVSDEQALKDLSAALAVVRHAGRTAVVGYCWGGLCAYLAARELPVACGISYYGGRIVQHLDKVPSKPFMYHFGERDTHIPLAEVEQIRAAHPAAAFHLYPAGHGFNCSERPDYDAASAALALQRSLDFLGAQLCN
jgi:carboxymethylenebutenolidase